MRKFLPIDEEHLQEVLNVAVSAMRREPAVKLFDLQDHDEFLISDMTSAARRSMKDGLAFMILENDRVVSCIFAIDSRGGPLIAEGCSSDEKVERWSKLNEDTFSYAPTDETYVYTILGASIKEHEGKGTPVMIFNHVLREAYKRGFKRILMDITSLEVYNAILRREIPGDILSRGTYKFSDFKYKGERPFTNSNLVMYIIYCDLKRMVELSARPSTFRAKL